MHLFSVKDDVLRLSHFVTDLVLKAIRTAAFVACIPSTYSGLESRFYTEITNITSTSFFNSKHLTLYHLTLVHTSFNTTSDNLNDLKAS